MILLLDIGNTRIKWASLDERGLTAQRAESYAGWDHTELNAIVLDPAGRPERVLVSNVGGAQIATLVRDAIAHRWKLEAEFVVSTGAACGVRNAYPVPSNLGVDRWLAVIAAHARQKLLTCVISVGTAMTIDGVDASGQHLGGVIVPGPDLMVASLLTNTSEIAQRALHGSAGNALFADNTRGAIQQGASHALAALVERTADVMRTQAGEAPTLLLTGGAVHRIESLIREPCETIPDLVLRGLARYATAPRE
jgi:type III pantothenate kinase